MIDLNKRYVGIEIGGTKLQIVTSDKNINLVDKLKFQINKSEGADGILNAIEKALKGLMTTIEPIGIGVGFGGPIDYKTGKISTSHQIEGWSNFDLAQWLRSLTNSDVVADNDANVAALAEANQGAGKGFDNVLYITLGSGVGGGFISNGKIFHGKVPGEVEIGHLRLNKTGKTVESSCSGWAVDKKIRECAKINPGILSELVRNVSSNETRFLREAIERGDPFAKEILETTLDDLALGLSHAIHLFHPDVIIIGGGLSNLGELLSTNLQSKISNYLMEVFHPGPQVLLSKLGEDVVPIGAIELVLSQERIARGLNC